MFNKFNNWSRLICISLKAQINHLTFLATMFVSCVDYMIQLSAQLKKYKKEGRSHTIEGMLFHLY
jgi:hypothetical protein